MARRRPVAAWSIRVVLVASLLLPACCATAPTDAEVRTAPRLLHRVAPIYPPQMERIGAEASLALACDITETGTAADCSVTRSTDHRFDNSALASVRASLYAPATRNGIPVAARHTFSINYEIDKQPHFTAAGRIVCAVDPAGHVSRCRGAGPGPLPHLALLSSFMSAVVIAPTLQADRPVDDPQRRLDVVMAFQPVSWPQPVLPPMKRVISLLVICREGPDGHGLFCSQATAMPAASPPPPAGPDRIFRVTLGLDDLPHVPDGG